MEVAYNAKEQQATILSSIRRFSFKSILYCPIQVEAELGTMREQLSSELRRAVGGGSEKWDAKSCTHQLWEREHEELSETLGIFHAFYISISLNRLEHFACLGSKCDITNILFSIWQLILQQKSDFAQKVLKYKN